MSVIREAAKDEEGDYRATWAADGASTTWVEVPSLPVGLSLFLRLNPPRVGTTQYKMSITSHSLALTLETFSRNV